VTSYASRHLKYLWSYEDNDLTHWRHFLSCDVTTPFLYSPPERFQLLDFTTFSLSRSQRHIHHIDIAFYDTVQNIFFATMLIFMNLYIFVRKDKLESEFAIFWTFDFFMIRASKRHCTCRCIHILICLRSANELILTFCDLSTPIDSHLLEEPSRIDRKGQVCTANMRHRRLVRRQLA